MENGRVFTARRPPGKSAGLMWEFPGGKIENGETPEESLVREIREELCWDIRVDGFFHLVRRPEPQRELELYAFWCSVIGGDLNLREHVAFRWATPEELYLLDLTPADRELIPLIERTLDSDE